jgi:acetoin utilization deacetylase AcuC-like enzyme
MAKYGRLRERVRQELPEVSLQAAPAAADDRLRLAHGEDYVRRVVAGELSASEQRAIGFPWTREMVERSRRSVGATLAACAAAAAEGVAVNLAGGTHHAQRDGGHGYCVFNDVAIAALARCLERPTERVAIIDLDVHQGDGTAAIVRGADRIFALSLHGDRNYPARKIDGHIDVGLPDGTGDEAYLAALDDSLARMLERFVPTFLVYLAGADPHEGDRLGRLKLSDEGLVERDRRVFTALRERAIPVAVTMAGGYGHDVQATVAVHLRTLRAAAASCDAWQRARQDERDSMKQSAA